jgi:hypothetical protein
MKEPSELECLTLDEINATQADIDDIMVSLTKSDIGSLKNIGLPPTFTLNVLTLSFMILFREESSGGIPWVRIKKELLGHPETLRRVY